MIRGNPHKFLSAAIGLCAFGALSTFAGEMPTADNGWVRAAPPNVTMHAAYLTLHNHGVTDIKIVDIESLQYESTEIHHSTVVGGVATMMKQDQLKIVSGGKLNMFPGGYHVMLIKPKKLIGIGDKIDIKFHFSDGTALTFDAEVSKTAGTMMSDHSGHMNHKKN